MGEGGAVGGGGSGRRAARAKCRAKSRETLRWGMGLRAKGRWATIPAWAEWVRMERSGVGEGGAVGGGRPGGGAVGVGNGGMHVTTAQTSLGTCGNAAAMAAFTSASACVVESRGNSWIEWCSVGRRSGLGTSGRMPCRTSAANLS